MNVDEFILFLISPASIIGLIIGLSEIAKILNVDLKLIPLVDLVLGLFFGCFIYGVLLGHGVIKGILVGIALGLSACGLFSGFKNVSSFK